MGSEFSFSNVEDAVRHYNGLSSERQQHLLRYLERYNPEGDLSESSGYYVTKSPWLNKGTSFTPEERARLHLTGLYQAGEPVSLDLKIENAMRQFSRKTSGLEKYIFLHTIQDTDETLYYGILTRHTFEVMPCIYTPVVGEACIEWHRIQRQAPRGVYVSARDSGNVLSILKNHPHKDIKVIVVTDGERILGLGDLGSNGMGIPVGKLAIYTACGGIPPHQCLPVQIDVGTNNSSLLNDPFYPGLKHNRIRGEVFDNLIGEFFDACHALYGRNVLIQFEDFGNTTAFHLLERFRNKATTFNDDIQGTASVVLAGVYSSLKILGFDKLRQHRFLFSGAGEAGVGIANLIAMAIVDEAEKDSHPMTIDQARRHIWLMDSKGLITKERLDQEGSQMAHHKVHYAHETTPEMKTLLQVVSSKEEDDQVMFNALQAVKPTALMGVSAQPQAFSRRVCESLAAMNPTAPPLIFPLSNPTSKAECTAEQAYTYTNGHCVVASGSPFDPVTLPDGREFVPGQGNNAYIFPGIGLACLAAGATSVTDGDMLNAAKSLASQVTPDRLAKGCPYPPLQNIREVSTRIACSLALAMHAEGRASLPRPEGGEEGMMALCQSLMYVPSY